MPHKFHLYSIFKFQSQRKGSNQDAKELLALIDLYTELQQEMFEAQQQADQFEEYEDEES